MPRKEFCALSAGLQYAGTAAPVHLDTISSPTVYSALFVRRGDEDAVKRENFKTCSQSGFCKRNRAYADSVSAQGSKWTSPYRIDPNTIRFAGGQLKADVLKTTTGGESVKLPLAIAFYKSGTARVTIDETRRQTGDIELRYGSKARKERYNEVDAWALVGGLDVSTTARVIDSGDTSITKIEYGPKANHVAVIRHQPFGVEFLRDGETHVAFNQRGLMNVEHWRPRKEGEQPPGDSSSEDESTWWEESFGGNTDTKPKGPESLGMDIAFPGYSHVFGIPEHAGPLSLRETRGGEGAYQDPYRLYNTDVFEYELDSPMTLYGAIPMMQAHRQSSTVGVLWFNAAETWIDITKAKAGSKVDTHTHWFSESGLLDAFVFLGPTGIDTSQALGELTGLAQLPQMFSIAYHQCRWNYMSDEEVADVDQRFDKHGIPLDVIWLDLEYTDDRKYFTWDSGKFPDPIAMQKQLATRARKLVTLVDPHIKNVANYHVVEQLKSKNLYIRNKDGDLYEGWCWPGSSHWVDCFDPAAREWWKTLFRYDSWIGSTKDTFIWNDMNEPSVFNGPETTAPKDNLHHGNWEHRDIHNINGMTFVNATYHALVERKKGERQRPFVLTRSFYTGGQRLGAMWTGDNLATWGHLEAAFPMLLSLSIAGFSFTGADVGGFFGNPDQELLTRWYQAGAFYPFYRAHSHIDTRRREPYLSNEPYRGIITRAIRLRYQLLPAWYTAFHEASTLGLPILRPQYYVHPSDEQGFGLDDQFYIGSTGILAKPVVTEGVSSVKVHLADDELYYDYFDYTIYSGPGSKTIDTPLERIPMFVRGGHVIPRRDRPRRSSKLMAFDPITLLVVLGKTGNAEGSLYLDDGEGFDYEKGAHLHWGYNYDGASSTLRATDKAGNGPLAATFRKRMASVHIDRIVIVGAPSEWGGKHSVQTQQEGSDRKSADMTYHAARNGRAAWATIRNPAFSVSKAFEVKFA